MSDSPLPPPAGWYPDPAGTNNGRWWNGTSWAEAADGPDLSAPGRPGPDRPAPDRPAPDLSAPDRHAPDRSAPDRPALDRHGEVASGTPADGTDRPLASRAYTPFIWAIVAAPLLSALAVAAFDMRAYLEATILGSPGVFSVGYLVLVAVSWIITIAIIVLSYFDYRRLRGTGFDRPFHWAWSFLGSGVYVIGRSVVVRARAGRGLLPIWIWSAVTALILFGTIAKIVDAIAWVTRAS